MIVLMEKDCKWSIDYKAVDFKKGQEYEIPDNIAEEMKKNGYAIGKKGRPTKESLIKENKAVESVGENKSKESKKSKKNKKGD